MKHREIKFKFVFDTHIGEYTTSPYTLEELLDFQYGIENILEKETRNLGTHDHDAFFQDEIILLYKKQYIGVNDNNNEEIYEFDNVQFYHEDDEESIKLGTTEPEFGIVKITTSYPAFDVYIENSGSITETARDYNLFTSDDYKIFIKRV